VKTIAFFGFRLISAECESQTSAF